MTSRPESQPDVTQLRALIALIPDPEPGELPDEQAHHELIELMAVRSLLEAKIAHRAEQWRTSGHWANDGSKAPTARLARDSGCTPPTAKRLLALGHSTKDMPATRAAWNDGRLTTDKVALLAPLNTPKRASLFARDETHLVRECGRFRYTQAVKIAAKWAQCADRVVDPDGTPPMPETYAKTSVTYGGAVAVDAMLDPVGGEMFTEQLHRIETELYRTDLATGIQRTITERRAAALVEMAVRAGTAPKDGKRPEPLICVVAGERALRDTCETLAGTMLHPAFLGPYLTDAQVQSFIYDGVHDITGASRVRSFRGTLRRAIQVRDRHCQHPSGCDVPATRCDGDHYPTTYAQGGMTSMGNGRAMCDRHKRNHQLRDRAPTEPVPNYQAELHEPPPPTEAPPTELPTDSPPLEPDPSYQAELTEPPPPTELPTDSPPLGQAPPGESPPKPVPYRTGPREITLPAPNPTGPPERDLTLTPVADREPPKRTPDLIIDNQSVWLDYALAAQMTPASCSGCGPYPAGPSDLHTPMDLEIHVVLDRPDHPLV